MHRCIILLGYCDFWRQSITSQKLLALEQEEGCSSSLLGSKRRCQGILNLGTPSLIIANPKMRGAKVNGCKLFPKLSLEA